jgi:hypothetical protein
MKCSGSQMLSTASSPRCWSRVAAHNTKFYFQQLFRDIVSDDTQFMMIRFDLYCPTYINGSTLKRLGSLEGAVQ